MMDVICDFCEINTQNFDMISNITLGRAPELY